jgi:hypothetical protein
MNAPGQREETLRQKCLTDCDLTMRQVFRRGWRGN